MLFPDIHAINRRIVIKFTTRFIFITGGVVSSLGKGIASASLGALLESIEGTDDQPAPPSPPFTELHEQGELLLLTGATKLAHWSMSVEAADAALVFQQLAD